MDVKLLSTSTDRDYSQVRRMVVTLGIFNVHEMTFAGVRPSFENHLALLLDYLPVNDFRVLQTAVLRNLDGQRVRIPGHKQGSTVSYGRVRQRLPAIAEFYRSPVMFQAISEVVGVSVQPTPLNDQSSCSILIYDRVGDRIGWHYDHNFYNGRHFTALLSLENMRFDGGPSSSVLSVKENGRKVPIPTPPNSLVLFEGAKVRHCVSPLDKDERRVMLSMTYCADSETTPLKDVQRRFKDIAYFGLRALWDRGKG